MASFSRQELDSSVSKARKAMLGSFEASVTQTQRMTTADRGVKGPRWVSKTHFQAPLEKDACSLLLAAIDEAGEENAKKYESSNKYDAPTSADVPVQWTGYRSGVGRNEPEPAGMSEQAKFDALNNECKNDVTIMYMYGGAHFINGPSTRRATATLLSELTGARCVIVQHRLAPQNPFPCQLLDMLHAYLSLLHPPPGSFHTPVDPQRLVIAGDSTGGQLGLGLLQIILSSHRLHKGTPTLQFHGRTVTLPQPAGLAVNSPAWGGSLPSWQANQAHDLFPLTPSSVSIPYYRLDFPPDAAWPTTPPRENIYAHPSTYMNPIINAMVGTAWAGLPPMYIAMGGGEMQADPARVVAQEAARQGVSVLWEEYELLPHNFPMLLPAWPQSKECMAAWAKAILRFATVGKGGEKIEACGRLVGFEPEEAGATTRPVRELNVRNLTPVTVRQSQAAMLAAVKEMERLAKPYMEKWTSETPNHSKL